MKNNNHMGDKNTLFMECLNNKNTINISYSKPVMCKLFKHEQPKTHLDKKNKKTNTLSWTFRVLVH